MATIGILRRIAIRLVMVTIGILRQIAIRLGHGNRPHSSSNTQFDPVMVTFSILRRTHSSTWSW